MNATDPAAEANYRSIALEVGPPCPVLASSQKRRGK